MAYDPITLLELLVRLAMLPPLDLRSREDAPSQRSSIASGAGFVDNTVYVLEVCVCV